MIACVCNGTSSVLVNSSPTLDFTLEKGMKQGDLLSPFLFILVVEGLSTMMSKAATSGAFKGFRVNYELVFDLLQFADDTVILCKPWSNIHCVKAILRGFELVSGLKINLCKSSLSGVNIKDSFMEADASYLCCVRGNFPINFLGIPVGYNHRTQFV